MREFDEVPVFPSLERVSVGFAFDVSEFRVENARARRSAFMLMDLSQDLKFETDRAREAALAALDADPAYRLLPKDEAAARKRAAREKAERETVHGLLIEPVRSFLDDVTNGPPGVNGRPLLVLASGAEEDDEDRLVTLRRLNPWDYEFEGETTEMTPNSAREIPLWMRDSFCVFEGGRIYYVLHLVQPEQGSRLDEYALLQLQQLSLEPELAANPAYLAFGWRTTDRSLIDHVNARLEDLSGKDNDRSAVNKLLRAHGLLRQDNAQLKVAAADLANMCVGIEDEKVQRAADYIYHRLDAARETDPQRPDAVRECDEAWDDTYAPNGVVEPRVHLQKDNPVVRPRTPVDPPDPARIGRTALVMAGLATGVPDFPFQDESEIHDSTRLTARSVESVLYTHPRFFLEVGRSWRSFKEALDALGNCPYLYLTWMVTIHDEQAVAAMERDLERLIYDPRDRREKRKKRSKLRHGELARAQPLTDVVKLLNSASNPFGQKAQALERNLRRRLEIFRWESIHRCGNMFRYPKETAALGAVRTAMGTSRRFDEVHGTLDRLENLVEDVSSLASTYSQRATARLVLVITVFGILSVPDGIDGLMTVWAKADGKLYVKIALAMLAFLLIVSLAPWLWNLLCRGCGRLWRALFN